jgi:glutamate racemase
VIGIFDSGIGGLSVLAAIVRALPDADMLYLADTAHVPYGPKSEEFIRGRVLAIGRHLAEQGCNTLVLACNTATAAAIDALRAAQPDLTIIGVEPGVKPAVASSKSRRIAVLVTEATARSASLARLIQMHAGEVHVHVEACPGWARRIETLDPFDAESDPDFAAEVAGKLLPLLEAGADRIVLGCTHYNFLAPLLLVPLIAGRAELVDVDTAVARQVARLVSHKAYGSGKLRLQSTAQPERLHAALPALGLHHLIPRIDGTARHIHL